MSYCRVLDKLVESLASRVMQAELAKGIRPEEVKADLKRIRDLAEELSKRTGCPLSLDKIDALIAEADEDSDELRSVEAVKDELSRKI